jgi:MFS family permease
MPMLPRDSASLAAFRYPNFRRYMAARVLGTLSTEMQAVAVAWQVYSITHKALDLGIVGLAQFMPGICLFLVAGEIADRLPRHRILMICYAGFSCSSILLLGFALWGVQAVYPIYAILLLSGTVRAFNSPAGQAFIPQLVPEADFPNAIAWSSSLFQAATIAGPMIGGLLYGITGSPVPVYGAAACGYAAGLALMSRMHVAQGERLRSASSLNDMLEGLRYIMRNELILGAISLDLFAVLLGGAVALLPIYAKEILRTGAIGLGILRGAPGAGAVLMSIAVAHWPLRRKAGPVMLWCVAAFGVFTVVFGVSKDLALSLVMLVLLGAADTISVIVRHTMVQLATPDEMRGRVSAVNMVFIGASNEIGQFESGITAQWFGTVPAVVFGGIGTVIVVGLWTWLFPGLRRLDRMTATETVPIVAEAMTEDAGSIAE